MAVRNPEATVPTQAAGNNSLFIANTAFVTTAVSNAISGVNPAVAVKAATAAILPNSPTYNNGVGGVGATVTAGVTNTTLVVDGYTPVLLDRILVKNEANGGGLGAEKNGVYYVSQLAALGLAWVLTRALDYNQPSDMNDTGAIPVINGTANIDTSWVQTSEVITVGTDAVTFTQFSLNPTTIVVGPGSSTDNAIARYDSTTGKIIQNSGVTVDDSDNIVLPSGAKLQMASQNRVRYLNSMVNAYQATAQTGLAVNGFRTFNFDAEHFDTDGLHDNSTQNSRLTAALAGKYLITGTMAPVNNSLVTPTAFYLAIHLNNTTYIAFGIGAIDRNKNSAACVTVIYTLAVNDYVELQGNLQAASGTYNTSAADYSSFSMAYLGE